MNSLRHIMKGLEIETIGIFGNWSIHFRFNLYKCFYNEGVNGYNTLGLLDDGFNKI